MDQTILEIKKNIKNMNIINKIINEIQTPKLLLESLEKNIKLFNDIQLLTISKKIISRFPLYLRRNLIFCNINANTVLAYPKTQEFLNRFIKKSLYLNKIELDISNFYTSIKNNYKGDKNIFKNINTFKKFEILLIYLSQKMNSIFDTTFSNTNFINRIIPTLKNPSQLTININSREIEYRIKLCFDLFGKSFFRKYNIIIMTFYDFRENLKYREKYEYLCYIRHSILQIMNHIKNCLNKYESSLVKLDKIINKNYNNIQIIINDHGVINVLKKWKQSNYLINII
jgi:hypothetical protein